MVPSDILSYIMFSSPDGLSVSVISSTTTSLTISWALEEGITATSYSISYSATDTDCIPGSNTIPPITGSETMYTLDDQEEGTEYSITVTATLTGGGSEQDMAVGTTVAAGESNSHSPTYSRSLNAVLTRSLSLSPSSICPSLFCEGLSGELHCHLCPVGTSGTLC